MKTIIVASNNPVKVESVRAGYARMFPGEAFTCQGMAVPSHVSDQPFSSEETLQGAFNRASGAREQAPTADYWVGIEGGVEPDGETELGVFAWVVVLSDGQVGRGSTGIFYLPPRLAELVHQGTELGEADDIVFGRSNSKQKNGAVGLLTGDALDRAGYYEHAVMLALIPFRNRELYIKED